MVAFLFRDPEVYFLTTIYMYSDAYSVCKNDIRINIPDLIRMVENPDFDSDCAISHYEEAVNDILREYNTVISNVDVSDVRLCHIQHIWFIIKLVIRLQDLFLQQTEAIYITNASIVFKLIWNNIKNVLMSETLQKIHIS